MYPVVDERPLEKRVWSTDAYSGTSVGPQAPMAVEGTARGIGAVGLLLPLECL